MKIETLTVGSFAMNSYLVMDTASRESLFIDPGAESDRLIRKANELEADVRFVLNTHCHIDHAAEIATVIKAFKAPYLIHQADLSLLHSLKDQGTFFGIPVSEIPEVSRYVQHGDILKLGKLECVILHTPGHSPGGISVLIEGAVFVGDCLFYDSIGRTDLPGGNYDQLIRSITANLLTLPDSTTVYPGHGPATSVGREKANNPFLKTH